MSTSASQTTLSPQPSREELLSRLHKKKQRSRCGTEGLQRLLQRQTGQQVDSQDIEAALQKVNKRGLAGKKHALKEAKKEMIKHQTETAVTTMAAAAINTDRPEDLDGLSDTAKQLVGAGLLPRQPQARALLSVEALVALSQKRLDEVDVEVAEWEKKLAKRKQSRRRKELGPEEQRQYEKVLEARDLALLLRDYATTEHVQRMPTTPLVDDDDDDELVRCVPRRRRQAAAAPQADTSTEGV